MALPAGHCAHCWAQHVAIRGYPFNVLSEKSLAPLEHSAVLSLALIDANITDVEKNTFSGFSSLRTLSLDSNRLASVKQTWFAGLKKLVRLTLSNNNIRQIEPRSFVHLDLLFFLDLESNLLHDVDPAWFNGLKYRMLHMNMSLNPIHTISRGSFQLTKLRSLDLSGTDVSCLDEDVFRGQSWLNRLHVGSGLLSSVNDAKPHELTWSLLRLASTNIRKGSVKLSVAVPRFLFCVSHNTDTDHSINLTHYSEYTDKEHTSSEQGDNSTLQDGTTTCAPVHVSEQIEVPPATDHVLISVVVSVVAGLAVSSIAVLVWKMCLVRTREDDRPTDSAQVWTIPRGVAFPGLLRSASLPAGSSRTASHGVVSYTSMPTLLQSMEPASCEISFDRSIAQRTLPRPPNVYWEVPDDDISVAGVVRSASLPALSTSGSTVAPDDAASCRSLSAVLPSTEPTYSEIPDHMAAAQHPLPVSHTYSEVPDDEESVGIPFYADAAEILLQIVTSRVQNGQAYQDITTRGSITTYGSPEINNATRQAPDAQGIRAHINLSSRKALVSHVHATDQSVRTYVNVTDEILSRGQKITGAHVAVLTFPRAYWQISGEGSRITPRRASLPLVTLPITKELQGLHNTTRRAALPTGTLHYTSWLRAIPGEGTRNMARRASLPTVTPSNTYWPWGIPGEGTHYVTQSRASLPTVTLPNTYWPWEIPGEGTRNTPRRASLPTVTLPNTYWPWGIPGEGTHYVTQSQPSPTKYHL
ncbi:PREDICTED: uncharacterized protein LOC109486007 [Branchiostoma belcheri]|uniref:Uncharacterized protein LOC109486007 n=1 Tax=Branchiostoma belcheri TaxID=7741 RepID=A0A6P5ATC0_BRABE|nr:PREDICTED: uncharacterized protein LOC109486007 [Branchiostoma belcheri]